MIGSIKQTIRGLLGGISNFFERIPELTAHEKKLLGTSVEGRPIDFYQFGSGEKKILFLGGMHGNEVGTIKLMKHWVAYLATEGVPDNVTVFVIPCLNPDGYVAALKNPDYMGGGKVGKYNANKVDLNRNFDTSTWSPNATMFIANTHYEVSGGEAALSEPETLALSKLLEEESIETIYVYHNRWGTVMGTFTDECDRLVHRYAQKSGYRIFGAHDRELWGDNKKTGHFTVWGIENMINIVEIELATRRSAEWKKNKEALIDTLYE